MVSEWAKKLPANAVFVRVPVAFGRAEWGQLVRAYYALQATGDLARLDTALFEALHKEHQPLFTEQALTTWAAAHGVPAEKFKEAFNSFNVSTRASHAERLSRDYNVQGVPHVVIDGKYEVEGSNFDQILANATQIVEMAAKKK
jgi:thiol:disulfide interchange protein DsbA